MKEMETGGGGKREGHEKDVGKGKRWGSKTRRGEEGGCEGVKYMCGEGEEGGGGESEKIRHEETKEAEGSDERRWIHT